MKKIAIRIDPSHIEPQLHMRRRSGHCLGDIEGPTYQLPLLELRMKIERDGMIIWLGTMDYVTLPLYA